MKRILCLNKSHFVPEFKEQGFDVLCAGASEEQSPDRHDSWSQQHFDFLYKTGESIHEIIQRAPRGFKPDAIIYYDDSRLVFRTHGFEQINCRTLFYSVDAHIHRGRHPQMAGQFHSVCVAQKDSIPLYQLYNNSVHWLPLWAPVDVDTVSTKEIDVCFRGNLDPIQRASRLDFLKRFSERAPLDMASGPYIEPFTRSKIILNEAISDDVNFRVFESLMCGGLLLTPRTANGLLDIFEDGVDLVTYASGDYEAAAAAALYYLEHEHERAQIAEAGRRRVRELHTAQARSRDLLKVLSGEIQDRKCRYFAAVFHATLEIFFAEMSNERTRSIRIEELLELFESSLQSGEKWDDSIPTLLLRVREHVITAHEYDRMIEIIRRLYQRNPEQGSLVAILLDTLVRAGRLDEARQYAEQLWGTPGALDQIGPLVKLLSEKDCFSGMNRGELL